jgi:hypothetical protein
LNELKQLSQQNLKEQPVFSPGQMNSDKKEG